MKHYLLTISGIATIAGSLCIAPVVHAATSIDCAKINMAGTYKTGPDLYGDQHKVEVEQDKCLLTVTESWKNPSKSDKVESHTWKLDLSGQTEFQVPPDVIALQGKDNNFGKETLQSLRGTATLVNDPSAGNIVSIELRMKMHIPKSQYSSMESDILITGGIALGFGLTQEGAPVSIQFGTGKIRLKSIDSPWYFGAFREAFINGANYVLRFLDNGNYIGLTIPQMQRFYRVN